MTMIELHGVLGHEEIYIDVDKIIRVERIKAKKGAYIYCLGSSLAVEETVEEILTLLNVKFICNNKS